MELCFSNEAISTVVLIMGLVDLIPRVKASIGAFAVCRWDSNMEALFVY